MKTVILCGGVGTRIRDSGEVVPSSLVPIGGRPMLWHIMKGFAQHGCTEFVLGLGRQSWLFKQFFLNYRAMSSDLIVSLGAPANIQFLGDEKARESWRVTLAETGEATLTGGCLSSVRRYLEGEKEFMVTYGDCLGDVDVGKLIEHHRASGKIATVTAVRPPSRLGAIRSEGGSVVEFNERPQTTEGFINGGYFVFDGRRVWDYLPGDPQTVLEQEPLKRLVTDKQLTAYEHGGFWQPMDTPRQSDLLNALWSGGRAPWKTWSDGGR